MTEGNPREPRASEICLQVIKTRHLERRVVCLMVESLLTRHVALPVDFYPDARHDFGRDLRPRRKNDYLVRRKPMVARGKTMPCLHHSVGRPKEQVTSSSPHLIDAESAAHQATRSDVSQMPKQKSSTGG